MINAHRFLFVMDPFETLNLATETSLLLMEDLLARGHVVLWAELSDLVLRQDKLHARVKSLKSVAPIVFDEPEEILADDVDAVLVRPDPPFDSTYLHLTYLLDFVTNNVLAAQSGPCAAQFQ